MAAVLGTLVRAVRDLTLATLRRDGSPRISGTEAHIVDGQIVLGMMPGSMKARDLASAEVMAERYLRAYEAAIEGRAPSSSPARRGRRGDRGAGLRAVADRAELARLIDETRS